MKSRLYERNQWILMVLSVSLGTISLILPQYVIFWQERGVEGAEPSFLEGAFAVIFALASVPAGMVADKFGRKRVLMFGSLFEAIGFAQYYFNYGVIDFLISEALIGIGMAAVMCSAQALLVESISAAGGTEQDELRMTARMKIYSYSTFILGAPLGGWLGTISSELPFLIASLGPLIGFCLAIFITETASQESEEKARFGFKEMFALRHRLVAGDILSGLMILSTVFGGLLATGQVLLQPHYKSLGHTAFSLGLLMALGQVILIWVTSWISKIEGAASSPQIRALAFCGLGLGYLLIALIPSPLVVVCGWLVIFSRAFAETVLSAAISAQVNSEERATILGLRGLLDGIARGILLLITGIGAETFGANSVFATVGVLGLGLALVVSSKSKVAGKVPNGESTLS